MSFWDIFGKVLQPNMTVRIVPLGGDQVVDENTRVLSLEKNGRRSLVLRFTSHKKDNGSLGSGSEYSWFYWGGATRFGV